jgi:hypothetical protein
MKTNEKMQLVCNRKDTQTEPYLYKVFVDMGAKMNLKKI